MASSAGASVVTFSNGETRSSPTSGQNLFTAAVNSLSTLSSTSESGKSLSETSREFSLKEESQKTKYEEVQIVTGEEGEKNVIQVRCSFSKIEDLGLCTPKVVFFLPFSLRD